MQHPAHDRSSAVAVKVAVTQLEYGKGRSVFSAAAEQGVECICAPAEEHELSELVRRGGMQHVIVGVEPYSGPLYDALPSGAVIARFGVGHDRIDKEQATRKGLLCTNTPGVLDDSVAEWTIALMLAASRNLAKQAAATRQGGWAPAIGHEMKGRTLAVIGCGPIGRRVARIASAGFGMTVVGCETADVDARDMQSRYGFTRITRDFADAVADAHYVSLHIPSTAETRRFINAGRIAQMPREAWLINTARGAVVDEAALFDALAESRLAGAALDVFECEPYAPVAPGKDLRTLDNVLMTPHIGSSTHQACERMAERALRNILFARQGRFDEMDLLNPQVVRK